MDEHIQLGRFKMHWYTTEEVMNIMEIFKDMPPHAFLFPHHGEVMDLFCACQHFKI